MEELITLLLHLVSKVPYHSEDEREAEIDLVRAFADHIKVPGIVPPAAGPVNSPPPAEAIEPPGPVAEPVTASTFPAPVEAPFPPGAAFGT